MQKTILDANAILRYVLDDIQEQADAVEEVLQTCSVLILPEVMAEVVYVLTKYYHQPRDLTIQRLLQFLADANCDFEILLDALKRFGSSNFDFVDCLLCEYAKRPNYVVFTFDKDLRKLLRP